MTKYLLKWIWFFCVIVTLIKCEDDAKYCTKLEAADGTEYNLETLIEKGPFTLPLTGDNDRNNVTVSLCSNSVPCKLSATNTTSVMVCACENIKSDGKTCGDIYAYGAYSPSGVKPLNDGAGVEFDYAFKTRGGTTFSTKIAILCDYNYVGLQNAAAVFKNNGLLVDLVIRTEAGCPVKLAISGGTIFMLIVLGTVVLYVVIGILVNKFSLMKEGREVMPHVEFWTDLPILVKDGAVFIVGKIRNGARSNPYEPVVA